MHGSLIFDNSGARRHSSSLQTRRRRPARNAIPRAEPHRAIWGPRTRATHNNVPHERQGDPKDERIYFPFFAPSSACREWYITRGKCCKNWMEVPHKKAKHADLTPSVCVIKYREKWVVKLPRCRARPQIQHANLANFEFLVRRKAAKWWWVRCVFRSSGNSNCSVWMCDWSACWFLLTTRSQQMRLAMASKLWKWNLLAGRLYGRRNTNNPISDYGSAHSISSVWVGMKGKYFFRFIRESIKTHWNLISHLNLYELSLINKKKFEIQKFESQKFELNILFTL